MNGNTSAEKVVTERLVQRGWEFDGERNLLLPVNAEAVQHEHSATDGGALETFEDMASLTSLVGFLGE